MADITFPKYTFGLHEPGGERLMEEKGKRGWILFTHGLGHDPNDQNGHDYRPWTDRGFGVIARLNHGYGAAGTLPLPQFYDAFALRMRNFVANSPGGHIWIIGNEMNHGQERPEGQVITPDRYAACYKKCWDQVHSLPNREHDQVAVGSVAPWNNTTAYPGNEGGDWVKYFCDIVNEIRKLGCPIDAITHHAYTHGHDPNLIFSEQKMNAPFQNYHYHFRCYRDFMEATPPELRNVPVYITEADEDEPWENANRGWVRNAYKEIDDWNNAPGHQQIRALILYRWPKYDKWHIEDKGGVHDDFRAAMDNEYTWREIQLPREINGYTVQGAFLDFYNQMGRKLVGQPISGELTEGGLKTQYFEKMVLQQDNTGAVSLKNVGVELRNLRQESGDSKAQAEVKALQLQIKKLQDQILELHNAPDGLPSIADPEPGGGTGDQQKQITEVVRPLWNNIVYALPHHASKRYKRRDVGAIQYLVINHSAVPTTMSVQDIARFHTKNMKWPGIGYHFFIDGQGRIHKTNELSTVCYHVQKWDPVSVGICVGGNFTKTVPNEAQIRSTSHLLAWLLQELELPLDAVKGKKEFIDTQSPGHQWLAGQVWKKTLLSGVQQAYSSKRIAHAPFPLYQYVLMWQSATDWAKEDWRGTQEYIGRFRVSYGFSAKDAQAAKYVTIVGDTKGVDRAAEQGLLNAGCRVERIAGKSPIENRKILTQMARSGQRFLSYFS